MYHFDDNIYRLRNIKSNKLQGNYLTRNSNQYNSAPKVGQESQRNNNFFSHLFREMSECKIMQYILNSASKFLSNMKHLESCMIISTSILLTFTSNIPIFCYVNVRIILKGNEGGKKGRGMILKEMQLQLRNTSLMLKLLRKQQNSDVHTSVSRVILLTFTNLISIGIEKKKFGVQNKTAPSSLKILVHLLL